MDDLISRQAVLEIQAKYAEYMGATKFWQMRDDIKALSSIKLQPKTGHWIKYGKLYQCSECEELSCCQGKFCNECGAKMIEPQERSE